MLAPSPEKTKAAPARTAHQSQASNHKQVDKLSLNAMQERFALPKGKKRFARLRKIAEATELSLGARLLAHVLDLHFMNRKTGACFPAHETLAAVLGVNEKTVRRYLDELRGAGWVTWWSGSGITSNRYVFTEAGKSIGANDDVPRDATVTRSVTETVTEDTTVRTSVSHAPDISVRLDRAPVSEEPIEVNQENITNSASLRSAGANAPLSEKFVEFWRAYPKSDRNDPEKPAREAFYRMHKARENLDAIIAAAERYAASGKAPRFVKNPASWLLDGNWKNEPLPAEPLVSEKMAMEEAVKVFIRTGRWSRHASLSDISQAPAELLDKYGLLPDGRKKAA